MHMHFIHIYTLSRKIMVCGPITDMHLQSQSHWQVQVFWGHNHVIHYTPSHSIYSGEFANTFNLPCLSV